MISSIAKYASVGTPASRGCTSTMTSKGFGVYRLNSSLISRSDARSLGPEWYQPISFSRALIFLNISFMPST